MRTSTLSEQRQLYRMARAVIERHYRRPLTVQMVARALASSPRQLQRAYQRFGHTTFSEDLFEVRMAAAARLLLTQIAIPVADVGRLVGYESRSQFARAFRRRYGVAPARFRERAASARLSCSTSDGRIFTGPGAR